MPQSGKTTVFNALTRGEAPVATGSGYGQDTHMAVVKVPDERLGVLTEMFEPRKTTPAEVQYTDFPGVGFGSKERSEAAWVGQLRTVDALLQVVRTFGDERPPRRPHRPRGRRREGAAGDDRLRPGDRRAPAAASGRGLEADTDGGTGPLEAEVALFQRFQSELESGCPLREVELSEEQARAVRGYQFLSAKPLLLVLNLGEDQLSEAPRLEAEVKAAFPHRETAVASLSGIEMELAQLEAEDATVFMADLGIEELARRADHQGLVRPHRLDLVPHHG